MVDAAVHLQPPVIRIDLRNVEGGVDAVEAVVRRDQRRDIANRETRVRGDWRRGLARSRQQHLGASGGDAHPVEEQTPDVSRHERRGGEAAGEGEKAAPTAGRTTLPRCCRNRIRRYRRPLRTGHVATRPREHRAQGEGTGGRRAHGRERRFQGGGARGICGRGETERGERDEHRVAHDAPVSRERARLRADEQTQHDRSRDERRLVAGAEPIDAEPHEDRGSTVDHLLRDRGDERRTPVPDTGNQFGNAQRDPSRNRAGERGLTSARLQTRIRSSGGRTPMTARVRPIPRNMPQQMVRSAISSSANALRSRSQNASSIAR